MIFCLGFLAIIIGLGFGVLLAPSQRGSVRWFVFVVFPVTGGLAAMAISVGILLWRVMP